MNHNAWLARYERKQLQNFAFQLEEMRRERRYAKPEDLARIAADTARYRKRVRETSARLAALVE